MRREDRGGEGRHRHPVEDATVQPGPRVEAFYYYYYCACVDLSRLLQMLEVFVAASGLQHLQGSNSNVQ